MSVTVIGVRFKEAGKIYSFDPGDFNITTNDHVIVETARGIEYGSVVVGLKEVDDSEVVPPLKKVIRIATADDDARVEENAFREKEAFAICLEKIEQHKDDKDYILKYGIEYASNQCKDLIENNVKGLHFYTLNKSCAVNEILNNIQRATK